MNSKHKVFCHLCYDNLGCKTLEFGEVKKSVVKCYLVLNIFFEHFRIRLVTVLTPDLVL